MRGLRRRIAARLSAAKLSGATEDARTSEKVVERANASRNDPALRSESEPSVSAAEVSEAMRTRVRLNRQNGDEAKASSEPDGVVPRSVDGTKATASEAHIAAHAASVTTP